MFECPSVRAERERVGHNVCERRETGRENVSEKIVCWSVGACMRVRVCVCVCAWCWIKNAIPQPFNCKVFMQLPISVFGFLIIQPFFACRTKLQENKQYLDTSPSKETLKKQFFH